ncbi:hypothetical protein [Andreprevotia chitinilytica]|uniref:hypothetical protein n=1 Tax=Andreprevotia chitinilytica TaxID=396808 RepID=UPI000554A407|nr:hypothetical protein [Andreprevotia chitinilytica]
MHRLTTLLLAMLLTSPLALAEMTEAKTESAQLAFLDSRLFDGEFANLLKAGKSRITVDFPGKISLSKIPERLDRWITAVGTSGKLELQPEAENRPKDFLGVIPTIFSLIKEAGDAIELGRVKHYNAVLTYRKDASGDAIIDQIIFTRKPNE